MKAGADGFTAIDSIGPTLQIDIETGEPTIGGAGNKAWMSGAAIRPVAQAVVSELAVALSGVPIVGTGGIIQAEDAVEMTMVGASALGVCTGPLLRGLEWFERTGEKLSAWLDSHGYADLAAVRGMALPKLHAVEDTSRLTFEFEPMKCTKCDLCVVLCPYDAREMGGGDKPKTPDPDADPGRRSLPLLRPVRRGVQAGVADVRELAAAAGSTKPMGTPCMRRDVEQAAPWCLKC